MSSVFGVLAIQGSVIEHQRALESIGCSVRLIRESRDLEEIYGLIIPGGESTTISKLMIRFGLDTAIKNRVLNGMGLYGTCAGAIIASKEVIGETRPCSNVLTLNLIDAVMERNAYGSQIDSFYTEIDISHLSLRNVKACFIRAPKIKKIGRNVQVLAQYNGDIVMAQEGKVLVSTFHPELTHNRGVHEYFVGMCRKKLKIKN